MSARWKLPIKLSKSELTHLRDRKEWRNSKCIYW